MPAVFCAAERSHGYERASLLCARVLEVEDGWRCGLVLQIQKELGGLLE